MLRMNIEREPVWNTPRQLCSFFYRFNSDDTSVGDLWVLEQETLELSRWN